MSYDKIEIDGKAPGELFVGGAPKPGDRMQRWAHTLVLCAEEYQPTASDLEFGNIEVLGVPLGDVNKPQDPRDVARVMAVSKLVAERLREGKNVAVTCQVGLNRSCLIAGMAMRMIGVTADRTIRNLRAARGENGLCNETFERMVRNTIPLE
jgi:protein-tyrosine phosphatase